MRSARANANSHWMSKGIQYHQEGRLDDAERLYRRVLRRQADNPDALHFLGVLAHQRGQTVRAISWIRRALEIQPNYPDAYNNLGRILRENGDNEEAIRACKEAIRLRDDFVLNPHGRYSHRCEYVASTLKQNDQTISHLEPVVLCLENKQPVSGFLVIAQRGPATAHQLK